MCVRAHLRKLLSFSSGEQTNLLNEGDFVMKQSFLGGFGSAKNKHNLQSVLEAEGLLVWLVRCRSTGIITPLPPSPGFAEITFRMRK